MKSFKFIKKLTFLFILSFAAVTSLQAQSAQGGWWGGDDDDNENGECVDCTSEISATASIVDQLECEGLQDLEFGLVGAGSSDDVSPNGGNESDEMAGKFRISGTSGAGVHVSLDFPDELTQNSGNGTISFSNGISIWNGTDNQGGGQALGTSGSLTLGNNGQSYVWVGGTINAGNNLPAGDYSSTITLEASYN